MVSLLFSDGFSLIPNVITAVFWTQLVWACFQAMFVVVLCVQTTSSGPHGLMWITPEAVETTSSWTLSVSTIVPGCVRIPELSKPEPPNGSQLVKLGRRSMQTPLWASGAWMRSRVLIATAPTTQSASSVPKVQSCNIFNIHKPRFLYLKSLTNKRGPVWLSVFSGDCLTVTCTFYPTDTSVNSQGTWGPWSDWSQCPALCGQVGVQVRSRTCKSHSLPCSGPTLEGKACNGPECPEIGEVYLV